MHQQLRGAGLQQLLQALGRLAAVQRQVHRAQLEHRQQAGHPLDGALLAQRHGHARGDTLRLEVMRETVGLLLKLGVGERAIPRPQCRLPTPGLQALTPQGEEVLLRPVLGSGFDLLSLGVRVIEQRCVGVLDKRTQHGLERSGHALDGRGFEQVGAVGEVALQAVGGLGEVVGQVEARIAALDRKTADTQLTQRLAGLGAGLGIGHVLVDLHLEQRVVAQVALRRQCVDQVLERQFLVRLRATDHLLHLFQQRRATLALVHLHPQHLGVDEEADQAFDFLAVAPGVGRADTDVGLTAVARQGHRQRRQGQHEHGLALAARLGLELRRQRRRHIAAQRRATVAGVRRTLVVQWQVQHRVFIAQLLLPILQLALALAGLQPGALPDRVVGVLHLQRRQVGVTPLRQRLVQVHELLHHQLARPAVRDNMVHAHCQHVLGRCQAQQPDPQQRAFEQVEGCIQRFAHRSTQALLDILARPGLHLAHLQANARLFEDLLVELALLGDKARAQALMAPHQRIQGLGQGLLVQRTAQAHRHRHVVEAAVRLQLPEEQHALLGIGQPDARAVVTGHGDG